MPPSLSVSEAELFSQRNRKSLRPSLNFESSFGPPCTIREKRHRPPKRNVSRNIFSCVKLIKILFLHRTRHSAWAWSHLRQMAAKARLNLCYILTFRSDTQQVSELSLRHTTCGVPASLFVTLLRVQAPTHGKPTRTLVSFQMYAILSLL